MPHDVLSPVRAHGLQRPRSPEPGWIVKVERTALVLAAGVAAAIIGATAPARSQAARPPSPAPMLASRGAEAQSSKRPACAGLPGAGRPRCRYALAPATRPRGVRRT